MVPRATRGTVRLKLCGGCGQAPQRAYGQRYCADCHRRSMRTYRAQWRVQQRAEAWELAQFRQAGRS